MMKDVPAGGKNNKSHLKNTAHGYVFLAIYNTSLCGIGLTSGRLTNYAEVYLFIYSGLRIAKL